MTKYTRDQIEREIEFSRLLLRNVIIHNADETMTKNARAILANPKMLEKFVFNRLDRKHNKKEKEQTKRFSLSKLMFWKK